MTFWGRYRRDQSFVAYPAKQRDVYKSRMEDKYFASVQKPERKVQILEEEKAEAMTGGTKKTGTGFWNSLLGLFAGKKEVTELKQPRWPAKK